jgi:large subunit ribosomal protein L36e
MSSEAPKTAKEPFAPKYEIATGLHKGRKLEKFVPKRVRPTRRVQVQFHLLVFNLVLFIS